ncbi:MAG: hypothetical protein VKJ09_15340, partial [Leptolyngbya sp.]|nr:hypothetical protein [Leptolyngbya sp.]
MAELLQSSPAHADPQANGSTAPANGHTPPALAAPASPFVARHIGPRAGEVTAMVAALGYDSLEALMAAVVPGDIR